MAGDSKTIADQQNQLDAELVPLAVAATVAYFHLTEASKQVDSQGHLADVVPVVALALSQVTPVYAAADGTGRPVNKEVDALLLRRDAAPPDLDRFAIRRGDLRAALATLREARHLFGGSS